eukprot:scaffold1455_cov87-Cyclotella_meneghiniana.AAC.3
MDNNALTHQPETGTIPSLLLSRVVGCWGVVADAVFDEHWLAVTDESKIFVFGSVVDGGAKLSVAKAAMTPSDELALTLGR